MNYQYELSAWIYHTIAKGDSAYAKWLHQNGYTKDKKQFKLFTFSHLQIPRYIMEGDRLVLFSDEASFFLSFLPERATEEFVKGAFASSVFTLGDRNSRVQCSVQCMELLTPPQFMPEMVFQTLSPVVISGHLPNGKSTYLHPGEADTARLIYENLCAKYQAYYNHPYDKPCDPLFKILSPVKRKKITVKADTPQQTYVVGYMFRFQIALPEELMRLMYETGVGEKGSLGFGMVKEY